MSKRFPVKSVAPAPVVHEAPIAPVSKYVPGHIVGKCGHRAEYWVRMSRGGKRYDMYGCDDCGKETLVEVDE